MMIGPAPMIRMLSMSVRLGISSRPAARRALCAPSGGSERSERGGCSYFRSNFLFHQLREAVEEVPDVVRPRARFGVPLKAERRLVGEREALQAAVEQRHMRHSRIGGQRRRIDGEAMVLARDQHLSRVAVEHGMVGTVVAKFHFHGLAADRETEEL